jgi:cytochrome c oxidase subunit 3
MPTDAVLEPQFAEAGQQRAASLMGIWVFLATEVLLFGSIVVAFLATRFLHAHDFEVGAERLNVLIGGVNTLVLLASSLTMALAARAAQLDGKHLTAYLVLTALLGLAFLGLKGYEYFADWRDGLIPGTARFAAEDWSDADPRHVTLFMTFYFITTGLHAVHLTIGIGIVTWLTVVTRRGVDNARATEAEVVGLYWHFVDVVWIFLLPLLYLSGHHTLSDLHF